MFQYDFILSRINPSSRSLYCYFFLSMIVMYPRLYLGLSLKSKFTTHKHTHSIKNLCHFMNSWGITSLDVPKTWMKFTMSLEGVTFCLEVFTVFNCTIFYFFLNQIKLCDTSPSNLKTLLKQLDP